MTTHWNRTRDADPTSISPQHRQPMSRAGVVPYALLGAALLFWVISLRLTDLDSLGPWGLIGAFPLLWYGSLAVAAGVGVFALVRPGHPDSWLLTSSLGLCLVILYGTTSLVEDAPRLAWTYKHIGVTRYILEQGSVDPAIDIFHRWPGAFAFGAYLSNLLGIEDPTAFAAWAQLFFAVLLAVLVYSCARSLSTNVRAAWIAAMLFSFTNWAGQLYYAPQPLALVLSLAILLLIIRFLRGPANGLGRWIEARMGGSAVDPHLPPPPAAANRVRAIVLTCVLGLQFASTISHQLTPYITIAGVVSIVVLGYVRPWWMVLGLIAIAGAYLLPNLRFVQDNYALINTLNPFMNFRARAEGVGAQLGTKALIGALPIAICLIVATLAVAGVVHRWRRGGWWPAVVCAALIGSPLLIGFVQNYGGEAQLRAFLFASPWCAVAGGWLLAAAIEGARSWRPAVITAAVTALLLVLFVPNYFGNEDVYYIPRTEVQACSWLSANSPDDAVFVQSVTGFPARCAGDYYEHVGSSRGDTPSLMSVDRKFANNDFTGNVPALTESVYQKVRSYGRTSRLIFSTSQERYARAWGLFGGEDGYRRMEAAVAGSQHFQLIYQNSDTRVYALVG